MGPDHIEGGTETWAFIAGATVGVCLIFVLYFLTTHFWMPTSDISTRVEVPIIVDAPPAEMTQPSLTP